jgi:hypothetical protein
MIRPSLSRFFTKRNAAILALSLAVIAAGAFLFLPAVIRQVLEWKISEAVHRQVTIRKVYFNPFALELALRGVMVSQRASSDTMLSFDEFSVNVQSLSVVKRGLIVDSVRLVKPYVNLVRNKDLTYNFSDLAGSGTTPPEAKEQQAPFKFSINYIEVVDGSADLYDAPRNIKHTVRDLHISVPFLSNFPDHRASYVEPSFEATVNGTAIAFKGKSLPFDESHETMMDINLENISLTHYLEYNPVPFHFKLLSGGLDVRAKLSFKQFKERSPAVSVTGTIALKDVRLADMNKKPLIELSSFSMNIVSSDLVARTAHISNISLRSPKIYVEQDSNGGLGILKALVPAKPKNGEARETALTKGSLKAEPEPIPDIKIDKITLDGGSIHFQDESIRPTFKTSLLDISGWVSGLSSRQDSTSEFFLRGSFNRQAPLVIEGKINPLRKELFADIKADLKNMELPPLTPYSGTYLGYAMENGKLSFSLKYHIAQKKLEAKNSIFVEQLRLGEKVDSPKETKLPVGMIISLLKDRKGEIRLDIPVSGATDDPDFNVWNLFLQELERLLAKAATSPFALLGSKAGGGELGYIEFDYGAVQMNEQSRQKLDALMKVLSDRPALKLEIAGYVDPANDGEALKREHMKGLIVAEKMVDLSQKKDPPVSPGSVQISAAEYPVYLKKAYQHGKFSRPRNVLGIAKDLPDAEMEKLLLDSIQVHDDDLRQLASQRARTTMDAIMRSQTIDPERVFLVEPRSLRPEQKDKLRNSRVEFSLK